MRKVRVRADRTVTRPATRAAPHILADPASPSDDLSFSGCIPSARNGMAAQ